MKNLILISLILFVASCDEADSDNKNIHEVEKNEVVALDMQLILNSAGVKGSILILTSETFFSNDFDWARTGYLPASTFKIPNSIIALELGIMENDSTMIYWDGKPKYQKRWEQDLSFKDAFHASCVPCYQEIARKIGAKQMKKFTASFNYGELVFDSTNLDMFWLEGDSKISQFQQIDFLKTFNEEQLSISNRTQEIMDRLMIIEQNSNYTLRGKSGWSVQNDTDNCWFVGYIETENDTHYFATNFTPGSETDLKNIPTIRKTIILKALESLGLDALE